LISSLSISRIDGSKSPIKWIYLFSKKKLQKKKKQITTSQPPSLSRLFNYYTGVEQNFNVFLSFISSYKSIHFNTLKCMIISIYFLCTIKYYLSWQSCNLHTVSDNAYIYIEKVHLIFSYLTKKISNSSYYHTRFSVLEFYNKMRPVITSLKLQECFCIVQGTGGYSELLDYLPEDLLALS